MDVILGAADSYLLTPYVYPKSWSEDWWVRQTLSLFSMILVLAYIQYFLISTISFYTLFDRRLMKHKHFLPNQIRKEIAVTCKSIPSMGILTTVLFVAEVRGHSLLYSDVNEHGWAYFVFTAFFFLFFTDMCIYFIHRGLHHPSVYKHLHKTHHLWIIPTPFASYAFHPLDGFLQSSPYHLFVFIFPMHKWLYLGAFMFVNFWTTSIHDANYKVPDMLKGVINCSAHHTDHHTLFNYNYGQFFTLWDKICGSHHFPTSFEGKGPIHQLLQETDQKAKKFS
jgi:lathosterol oxidase